MKKELLTICILVATCLYSSTAHSVQRVTVYGDDGYAPYSFNSNGTADGIYVKILEQAFKKMPEYKIKIELLPWKRVMKGLKCGVYFAAFPPYYRPDKRPWITEYSEPILSEDYSVFCRKEILMTPRPNWPDDYIKLQIGTNDGFSIPNSTQMRLQTARTNYNNIQKLIAGHIDCYVLDEKSFKYTIKKIGADRRIFKEGVKISNEYGYLAFSPKNNPKFKKDFISKFNNIISTMKKNGEIQKIVEDFLN